MNESSSLSIGTFWLGFRRVAHHCGCLRSRPALFALRLNVNETLKSGSRGTTGGRGHRRFRQALIVGQFALAMVLLAGAALYVRGR